MRRYRPRLAPEAAARIRSLHPHIKREIRQALDSLIDAPLSGHSLHFELAGLRSFRIRNYRIIYRISEDTATLDILFVGARRDVYEQLRELLLAGSPRE